jgi:hypothetical protein
VADFTSQASWLNVAGRLNFASIHIQTSVIHEGRPPVVEGYPSVIIPDEFCKFIGGPLKRSYNMTTKNAELRELREEVSSESFKNVDFENALKALLVFDLYVC